MGAYATVTVDPAIYNTETIFRTAYWFTDRFYVYLSKQPDNLIGVELREKAETDASLDQACADFCNALVDFRVRKLVADETAHIRDALVTKAFAEGAKSTERV